MFRRFHLLRKICIPHNKRRIKMSRQHSTAVLPQLLPPSPLQAGSSHRHRGRPPSPSPRDINTPRRPSAASSATGPWKRPSGRRCRICPASPPPSSPNPTSAAPALRIVTRTIIASITYVRHPARTIWSRFASRACGGCHFTLPHQRAPQARR